MRNDDRIRIRHMLEAAEEALRFAAGRPRADLDTDRMLVLAVIKCVEIVGEAASRVSQETIAAHPEIPWADIVGMRNRLVHVYFDVDADRVWDTLTDDLPFLVSTLGKLLAR